MTKCLACLAVSAWLMSPAAIAGMEEMCGARGNLAEQIAQGRDSKQITQAQRQAVNQMIAGGNKAAADWLSKWTDQIYNDAAAKALPPSDIKQKAKDDCLAQVAVPKS